MASIDDVTQCAVVGISNSFEKLPEFSGTIYKFRLYYTQDSLHEEICKTVNKEE